MADSNREYQKYLGIVWLIKQGVSKIYRHFMADKQGVSKIFLYCMTDSNREYQKYSGIVWLITTGCTKNIPELYD